MSEILMVKLRDGALHPADDDAAQRFMSWKQGDVIRVKYSKARNPAFHRKFFAMLEVIWDYGGSETWENKESMRKYLTAKAGYFDILSKKDGNYLIETKSISFSSMDEVEFTEVYNRVLDQGLILVGEDRRSDVNEAVDALMRFA